MQQLSNEFQEFTLSEEEALRACVFSPEQLSNLYNQRARIARDIINIPITRKDYDANLDNLIYLKGQLAQVNLLIDQHEAAERELVALASQHAPE